MSTEPRVIAGRYRVDELIGHGGMAKVYRGYDLTLGREVAIKILDAELARDTTFRTRFRLEAQAASRMSHPSIVRVYDAGDPSATDSSSDEPPYIVMELVKGTLLKDIISAGPVPVEDAVRYVDGILEALDYSHRAGVVHRDIKPGNVMVTDKGQVKVMDFGIARAVSDSSSTVAETTQIIGTAAYFSPEQAKGEPVDARADLYSTGVVLYELLTGRQPFRGESPVAVAYQHVSETPVPPTEVNEDAPGALDPIVLRALAKDPYQRYPDAAHFRAALDAAVAGDAPTRKQLGALTSELYGPSPRQAQETARSLRQLSSDTTMTRTQSGPPVAWIWAGVALLAVLLASVLFWVVTISMRPPEVPSTSRIIPNLENVSAERAQDELAKLDLTSKIVIESSPEISEGNVIRTDPEAGVSVEEGTTVTLHVSSGVETVTVPKIEGMGLDDATKALTAAGLELGTVVQRNDKALAEGTVISASEKAETEVSPGTVVNLVVASGKVTLTDVVGWTVDAATTNLTDLGLNPVAVEDAECPATDPTTVNSMSAAPGDVPVGSTVELRYCSGS
ncbi:MULTISPECIES: Stk1 family PASTA domain-containing Ser/Thr kinase [Microbacterium]|uniref:non-specific serine/threonine protein kinase n=1 Tax=Microbacterium aurugineum TaxID=2851642 RepID=A0ABY4J6N5_9MICO|nr:MULTISPECIES: Stk1 family PASTA domain-containing Ser/Thr kinase [Microbacterium]PKQ36315.1 MAG: serine/threonine protein kinase [Actinobacteria bacterium HGW-Actinobacteria-11]MCZ4302598.1 Stk1 family PASTA domain-containing Ser/Thr kinase [Microbacterium oxydans]QEA27952.1 Stk1 family PASTA domain-containing Ser/Thr kinase [Microbacterium sp. CBA3102]TCJ28428.1 Stk1 family PASTA domain-containing Ser/Thr kinase [Microbacterium sp. PI-1]UPL19268.1 Stk1 family PASTA domain-containing Ser/Th